MADENANPKIQFFKVPGLDHFSVIAPLTEKLAEQIVKGQVDLTQRTVQACDKRHVPIIWQGPGGPAIKPANPDAARRRYEAPATGR